MTEALVDLVIEDPDWQRALPDLQEIATNSVQLALDATDLAPDGFSVCILACDDDRIAALNAAHRGKDSATNVLSWPSEELSPEVPGDMPRAPTIMVAGMRHSLGDVAIALQTIEREAENASISLKNHTIHLILHGCLHLLGFDHETPGDAERMEGIETRMLVAAGLHDPYLQDDADGPRWKLK